MAFIAVAGGVLTEPTCSSLTGSTGQEFSVDSDLWHKRKYVNAGRVEVLNTKDFAFMVRLHSARRIIGRSRRVASRGLLLAGVALAVAGLTGCSLVDGSGGVFDTGEDRQVNDGNPSPTPSTSEQVQQAAHDEDPDTYCSLDEVNAEGWQDVDEGQMAFAYLPVFNGSTGEITSELDNEAATSTYVPYSTDKILLASTPLGSGKVEEDAITNVSVRLITVGLRDGWQVRECGPEKTLKITPIGDKKLKYLSDDTWYTKYWTLWELSGDDINPLPKDQNTEGFSADITVNGQTVHATMSNNLTKLPGTFAAPGDATGTSDPGMALVRFYYEHHVWS